MTGKIILSIILFIAAVSLITASVFSFLRKGFLFNNAYIYADKNEKEDINKKPYYNQSGVVFAVLGLVFLLNTLQVFLRAKWLFFTVIALLGLLLIYAILSTVLIEKKKIKKEKSE